MGEKIVALAGKLGVDPELVQLAMRVYVPPHVRVKNGKKENVDGYWRTVTRNSPLTGDEVKAMRGMRRISEPTSQAVRTQQAGREGLPGGKDRVSPPRYKKGQRVRVDTEQGWEEGEVDGIAREVVPGEGNRYTIKFDDRTRTDFPEKKVWALKKDPRETRAKAALEELIGADLVDEEAVADIAGVTLPVPVDMISARDTIDQLLAAGLLTEETLEDAGFKVKDLL